MSIQNLYFSKFDLYTDALSGRDSIGGVTRSVILNTASISCYFTKLSADEIYRYGKNNVIATHRLFCDKIKIKTTDVVLFKGNWYNIKYIDRCNRMDHHLEILLLGIKAPQVIEYSSSSSSSISQSFSSSSSSYGYSTSSMSSSSSSSVSLSSESSSSTSSFSSSSSTSFSSSSSTSESSSSSVSLSSESSSSSSKSLSSESSSSTEIRSSSSSSTPSSQSENSSSSKSESSMSESSSSSKSESSGSSQSESSESSSSSADTIYVCGEGISPDCTGEYQLNGTYGGYNAYERLDGAFWITRDGPHWYISVTGGAYTNSWYNINLISTYTASGSYDGSPIVQQTPCEEISSSSQSESSSSSKSESSSSSKSESSSSSSLEYSSSSYGYCLDSIFAEGFQLSAYDGEYTRTGEYNEKPYWVNSNGMYLFWDLATNDWVLSDSLGGIPQFKAQDNTIQCPYGTGCANWLIWGSGLPAGIVCDNELSSSSSSKSESSSSSKSESSSSSLVYSESSSSSSKSESSSSSFEFSSSSESSSSSSKSESSSSTSESESSGSSQSESSESSLDYSESSSSSTKSASSESSSSYDDCPNTVSWFNATIISI